MPIPRRKKSQLKRVGSSSNRSKVKRASDPQKSVTRTPSKTTEVKKVKSKKPTKEKISENPPKRKKLSPQEDPPKSKKVSSKKKILSKDTPSQPQAEKTPENPKKSKSSWNAIMKQGSKSKSTRKAKRKCKAETASKPIDSKPKLEIKKEEIPKTPEMKKVASRASAAPLAGSTSKEKTEINTTKNEDVHHVPAFRDWEERVRNSKTFQIVWSRKGKTMKRKWEVSLKEDAEMLFDVIKEEDDKLVEIKEIKNSA